ncbi:hypothetical protein BCR43DRAFT_498627 [Syncephalastrum racemosum]|uniref:Uncharacterized protein n=1 Tax=Syncephalastrum racemosum TaxID=13706 RepID=A0A1X2H2C5_SYNRA|nr:hypothetical protein BCR43DRAFT_498627 [Syncephalastrum racemosum]
MSSPPDDYAPPASHSHKRQDSHSYFRTSDPYRAVRKSTTPDSTGSSQQTDQHSRTASDSSTSRLAPAAGSRFNGYEYYDDDPYALPPRHEPHLGKKTRRKQHHTSEDERANSYLPYSHHRRDPYAAQEPIYLEEDNMPSFTSPNKNSMGGVGSLLQDNIAMDMVDQQPPAVPQKQQLDPSLDPLPEIKKRKRSRRLCGLHRRTLVFIVFIFVVIVAVIWYFVWPRYPPLYYLESKAVNSDWKPTYVTSTWYVNMTADNSENWVPTRIKNFEVELLDANTNQKFGSGSSGSIILPPRQSNVNVPFTFDIHYVASDQQDTTLQDLTLCSAVKTNPTPETPQSLNVIFQVTYHIEGFAWTKRSTVRPSGFQCPDTS